MSDDYTAAQSELEGKVNWVQLDQGGEDADHMISTEERLKIAMARQ